MWRSFRCHGSRHGFPRSSLPSCDSAERGWQGRTLTFFFLIMPHSSLPLFIAGYAKREELLKNGYSLSTISRERECLCRKASSTSSPPLGLLRARWSEKPLPP